MSPRFALAALVLAASTACARPTRITQPQPRDQLYASLIGTWQGTLEYRDDVNPDRRVTLPTTLVITPAPDEDGLELRYRYEDGPGTVVTSIDHLHFDRAMQQARFGGVQDSLLQRFAIVHRDGGENGAPLRLVLEGDGTDDDRPARIRETFEVSAGTVRIAQESQPVGGPFAFRHAYRLRRAQ